MESKRSGAVAINNDVVAQIASMAAVEVEGVAGLAQHPVDIKGVLRKTGLYKPVRLSVVDGVIHLDVYISVREKVKVKTVAENVQRNIKEKVQNMTGSAVTKVNVFVADIALDNDAQPLAPVDKD